MIKRLIKKIRASKTAFTIGVILLIINPPIGWIGFAVGGYFAAKYHNPKYLGIATVVYAITWGMAGAGVLLAGPRGVSLAKSYLKKLWGFLQRRRENTANSDESPR